MLRAAGFSMGLVWLVSCARDGGMASGEPAKAAARSRPPAIRRVFPPEGSRTAERQPEIGVDVSYREAGGAAETIRLFLDGREVGVGPVVGTMDLPQSGAGVVYRPPAPLSPGKHEARVEVKSTTGATDRYTWSFELD